MFNYKIIPIEDEEFINKLERVHYEVIGRQHIVNYMNLNGMNNDENYQNLWEEYLQYLKVYDILKNQINEKYLNPAIKQKIISQNYTWEIDFDTSRIKVYER